MNSYPRHQIALTIGAATAGLSATIMWRRGDPWAAALAISMGVILAAASHREAAARRATLVRHARARRAALIDEEQLDETTANTLLLVPCCQFWTATGGRTHALRCPVAAGRECPDAPPDWLRPPSSATAPTSTESKDNPRRT